MNRPLHTVLYMLLLISLFLATSAVYQSCGSSGKKENDQTSLEDKIEQVADEYTDEEFFEEDDETEAKDDVTFDSKTEDRIRSTPSPERTQSTNVIPPSPPSGGYLVVAGNYLLESNADIMVEKLRASGYNNSEKVVFDLSQYYTVIAGRYNSRSVANSISSELNGKGIDNYVLSRKN